MGLFSLDELCPSDTTPTPEDQDRKLCAAYLSTHLQKVNSLRELCGKLPEQGELMMLWTLKQFNAFTFIPYLIQYAGPIRELVLSTYSISSKVIDSLMTLSDRNQVDHIHLSISDSVKFRIPRVVDHLESLIQTRGESISVLYGWNHSKCALMRTDRGYYLVEGSGNFTENAQHEQYIFMNDEQLWNFRKECIYDISTGTVRRA